jgi:hypothetical protein
MSLRRNLTVLMGDPVWEDGSGSSTQVAIKGKYKI